MAGKVAATGAPVQEGHMQTYAPTAGHNRRPHTGGLLHHTPSSSLKGLRWILSILRHTPPPPRASARRGGRRRASSRRAAHTPAGTARRCAPASSTSATCPPPRPAQGPCHAPAGAHACALNHPPRAAGQKPAAELQRTSGFESAAHARMTDMATLPEQPLQTLMTKHGVRVPRQTCAARPQGQDTRQPTE